LERAEHLARLKVLDRLLPQLHQLAVDSVETLVIRVSLVVAVALVVEVLVATVLL
jgi:hypothetical protein